MKIFLSWSGEGSQSHRLAQAFREWLPEMFHSVKPFFSPKDIYAGVQWFPKLKAELETADFGIVCLTRTNLTAPYIQLESGAIAMRVGDTKLVPVLCDMSITDLGDNPLRAFNCVHLGPEGILKLVESINHSLLEPVSEEKLSKRFYRLWPDLKGKTEVIMATPDKDAPAKKDFDLEAAVEQILTNIAALARNENAERLRMLELMEGMLRFLSRPSLSSAGLSLQAPSGRTWVANALLEGAPGADRIYNPDRYKDEGAPKVTGEDLKAGPSLRTTLKSE